VSDRGYGLVKIGGKKRKAHRVVWELYNGPIPVGKEPHHECENKRCVNPGHLRLVSRAEHVDLSPKNITHHGGRRVEGHCLHGHALTPENTYMRKGGGRVCRMCNNLRVKRWLLRKKSRRPAGVEVELVTDEQRDANEVQVIERRDSGAVGKLGSWQPGSEVLSSGPRATDASLPRSSEEARALAWIAAKQKQRTAAARERRGVEVELKL
jgi:HNH endonuclease